MVVLWCEAEDDQSTANIAFCLVLVCVAEESRNSKLAALDPQSRRFASRLKRHEPAVCAAHKTVRVVGGLNWPCIGF